MELEDPSSRFDLKERVAVVTGASAGLGVGFAAALAGAGAQLVIAARRYDRLVELAGELEAAGADVLPVACDVTRESDVDDLLREALARFGRVDVLVNNAGVTEIVAAEEDTDESFSRVVDINLRGVFTCTQRFGRSMLDAGGGSIINIASMLGMVGVGQIPQASYAASKGGVISMTREIAAQWARRGVRVNAIAPGWFESEMTGDMFADESSRRWMNSRTPMGRPGHAGELDGALLFLASDASSFVTGQTLAVDGGWTIV
jgi:NAD(P)-dependent dehydrogenase (short-subunit alcohol dehydrogenase family)